MAQQPHTFPSDTYYIVILLLLSYVMSSAPRFVKEWRNNTEMEMRMPAPPLFDWKKALDAYTIQPYRSAWNKLAPAVSKEIAGLYP